LLFYIVREGFSDQVTLALSNIRITIGKSGADTF
jgi:hypothetical protein